MRCEAKAKGSSSGQSSESASCRGSSHEVAEYE